MKVVLVHGFQDNGTVMGKLASHLAEQGYECLVPTLDPHDAREGLPMMALQLHALLEEQLASGERFALVGFSMGALIARYYLQELGGHQRADAFFSISGPHEGTWSAYLHSSEGVNQMRPGSTFLNDLKASSHRLESLPITSYWTPFDLIVIPAESSCWSMGEEVRIPTMLHHWMISDSRLMKDLSSRLNRMRIGSK
jgi:triacylglycerol lipase